jgi:hypothetical protein
LPLAGLIAGLIKNAKAPAKYGHCSPIIADALSREP